MCTCWSRICVGFDAADIGIDDTLSGDVASESEFTSSHAEDLRVEVNGRRLTISGRRPLVSFIRVHGKSATPSVHRQEHGAPVQWRTACGFKWTLLFGVPGPANLKTSNLLCNLRLMFVSAWTALSICNTGLPPKPKSGYFTSTWRLPADADTSRASAELDNGVLRITFSRNF